MSFIAEDILKGIASAIQRGLKRAEFDNNNTDFFIHNSYPKRKVDWIINSLKEEFDEHDGFRAMVLLRGINHQILLEYDSENKILYSFMALPRMYSLLSSTKLKDIRNYIFGLSQFNTGKNFERQQLTISDELFDVALEENQKVYKQVRDLLKTDDKITYVTIAYNIKGYEIFSIDAYCISQYREAIKIDSLNDYIDVVDYDVAIRKDHDSNINTDDLDIDFKPEILMNIQKTLKPELLRNDEEQKNKENNYEE